MKGSILMVLSSHPIQALVNEIAGKELDLIIIWIGICESHIENTLAISQLLQYHKNKGAALENITQSFNLKKKNEGHHHRSKVYRCFLHSKKPMPNREDSLFAISFKYKL